MCRRLQLLSFYHGLKNLSNDFCKFFLIFFAAQKVDYYPAVFAFVDREADKLLVFQIIVVGFRDDDGVALQHSVFGQKLYRPMDNNPIRKRRVEENKIEQQVPVCQNPQTLGVIVHLDFCVRVYGGEIVFDDFSRVCVVVVDYDFFGTAACTFKRHLTRAAE